MSRPFGRTYYDTGEDFFQYTHQESNPPSHASFGKAEERSRSRRVILSGRILSEAETVPDIRTPPPLLHPNPLGSKESGSTNLVQHSCLEDEVAVQHGAQPAVRRVPHRNLAHCKVSHHRVPRALGGRPHRLPRPPLPPTAATAEELPQKAPQALQSSVGADSQQLSSSCAQGRIRAKRVSIPFGLTHAREHRVKVRGVALPRDVLAAWNMPMAGAMRGKMLVPPPNQQGCHQTLTGLQMLIRRLYRR